MSIVIRIRHGMPRDATDAETMRACTLTNKQTSETRVDVWESIPVDNKQQACPCASLPCSDKQLQHDAMGEFLFAAFENQHIAFTASKRRKASHTARLFSKLYQRILMTLSRNRQAISIWIECHLSRSYINKQRYTFRQSVMYDHCWSEIVPNAITR